MRPLLPRRNIPSVKTLARVSTYPKLLRAVLGAGSFRDLHELMPQIVEMERDGHKLDSDTRADIECYQRYFQRLSRNRCYSPSRIQQTDTRYSCRIRCHRVIIRTW